jgi:hypothetical protein
LDFVEEGGAAALAKVSVVDSCCKTMGLGTYRDEEAADDCLVSSVELDSAMAAAVAVES